MYEFPASPAVGDVANGYRYNGVGWAGGPIVPTPTEQFFDLAGKTTFDIDVPAWASEVILDAQFFATGSTTNAVVAIASLDGTTFPATGYVYAGPTHNSGTSVYQTTPAAAASAFWLSTAGDQAALYGHDVNATITLRRPTVSAYFTCKQFQKNYDSAASSVYRTGWLTSVLSGALGNVLQIKKLRIQWASGTIPFTAGSFVNVRWIGGEVPQANGIVPEAAMDGRAYARRNGLWTPAGLVYISSTTFAGKTRIDVPLPDGFKSFQLRYRNVQPTVTSANYLWVFGSLDGTTFAMTDGNYNWRMIYTAGTGVVPAQWVAASGSGMGIVITPLGVNATVQYNNSGIIDIMQGVAATYTNVTVKTQSMTTQGIYEQSGNGYVGFVGPWKAIRIQCGVGAGEAFSRGDVDLYGFQ